MMTRISGWIQNLETVIFCGRMFRNTTAATTPKTRRPDIQEGCGVESTGALPRYGNRLK
jgi:hypothetical protein